jgi:integrase
MADTDKKQKRSQYKVPKFYLDGKDNSKPQPIFLKYSFAPGKRISYFTGERIEASNWSQDIQRVKRSATNAGDINDTLNSLQETASKAVRHAKHTGQALTKEELKNVLDIANGKQTAKTSFFEILEHFVKTESKLKSWTKGTHTKINTIKTQLEAFEQYQRKLKKSYRIDLREINEDFFTELVEFWRLQYDLRNSTIQKNIHILRWFFNWCLKKNLMPATFKGVKIDLKQNKKKIIFLDLSELKRVKECEIPPQQKYLDRTRDSFIFQCFTGLRYSDLKNLQTSDIKKDYIEVTSTIKTQESVNIELNDTTREILNKYKIHQEATGYALPVPVNQDYNKFLKKLAKLAGLTEKVILVHYAGEERIEQVFEKWQLISSHAARRSFITNGLALGIGSEVLRSWTGHKSEESFKAYYEVVKERKQKDMNKFKL